MNSSIRIFISFLSITLIFSVIYLLLHLKGDLVIALDGIHTPFLDHFFRYITFLGDGFWFVPLILLLLFFRYSWSAAFAALGIIQLGLVQGLKRNVFGSLPRPAEYFKDAYEFQSVEGVDIHHFYSFPSGHTATAFGITFLIILLLKPGKLTSISLFLLAFLVGISRIYLAQHFLIDVISGAVIGITSAFAIGWLHQYLQTRNAHAAFFRSSLRGK